MFSQLNYNHLFLIKNIILHGNMAIYYGLIYPLEQGKPINYPCQIYWQDFSRISLGKALCMY